MPRKPKIPKDELKKLSDQGVGPKECAEKFDVSIQAVHQAKKRFKVETTKNVSLESASRAVAGSLNTIHQLYQINQTAHEMLDTCIEEMRGDKPGASRGDAIKVMAEIRGQLKLQIEIFQTLYDLEAAAEFQHEVLEAIGNAAPDVRERIISNLQEKRAIRAAVQFPRRSD
jgi:hypothetical protein